MFGAGTGLPKVKKVVSFENGKRCRKREQHVLVRKRTRSERKHDARSSDGACQLRDAIEHEAHGADAAREEEREADVRVEEAAGRAEEEPRRDEQAEPEGGRDVERALEGGALYVVRGLHAAEREQQEHGRADEFEGGRLHVVRQARFRPEGSEMRLSRPCRLLCRHDRREEGKIHRSPETTFIASVVLIASLSLRPLGPL